MIKIKNGELKMYDISNEYKKYLSKYDSKVSLKENRKHYDYLFFKKLCCDFRLLEQKCKEYNKKYCTKKIGLL